jgi:hypothetical protein
MLRDANVPILKVIFLVTPVEQFFFEGGLCLAITNYFLNVYADLPAVTCRIGEFPGYWKFTVRRDWFSTM